MRTRSVRIINFSITRKKYFDEFTYVFVYSNKSEFILCMKYHFSYFQANILKWAFTFFISPVSPFKHVLQISLIMLHTETRVMFSVLPYNKQIFCI